MCCWETIRSRHSPPTSLPHAPPSPTPLATIASTNAFAAPRLLDPTIADGVRPSVATPSAAARAFTNNDAEGIGSVARAAAAALWMQAVGSGGGSSGSSESGGMAPQGAAPPWMQAVAGAGSGAGTAQPGAAATALGDLLVRLAASQLARPPQQQQQPQLQQPGTARSAPLLDGPAAALQSLLSKTRRFVSPSAGERRAGGRSATLFDSDEEDGDLEVGGSREAAGLGNSGGPLAANATGPVPPQREALLGSPASAMAEAPVGPAPVAAEGKLLEASVVAAGLAPTGGAQVFACSAPVYCCGLALTAVAPSLHTLCASRNPDPSASVAIPPGCVA